MDPETIPSVRSRIRMDLLPYCDGGSMISVDLSANCESGDRWSERIRAPDPWDQIPGSVFGIHGHVCLQVQRGPEAAGEWRWPATETSAACVTSYSYTHFPTTNRWRWARNRVTLYLAIDANEVWARVDRRLREGGGAVALHHFCLCNFCVK